MGNSDGTLYIDLTRLQTVETYAAALTLATGQIPFLVLVRQSEVYNNFQTLYAYSSVPGQLTRISGKNVPPAAPTNLQASVGTTMQVNLTWTAPTILGTNAIVDYVVQYQLVGAGSWTTFSHTPIPNTPAIAVTGLTNGSAYNFQVAASNSDATSAFSLPATATPSQLPGTPTSVTAQSAQNAQSTLTWTAPSSGGASITDYTVQYRTSATPGNPAGSWNTWSHTPSTATTQTVTGLTNEVSYDFQVAAVNANGTGAFSIYPTAIPEAFIFYISQVSGNDSNNGTSRSTPVLTVGKLNTLMNAYGNGASALFLEAGYYYEQLSISTLANTIVNLNFSTLDASNIVPSNTTSWTQPDTVDYPNVWHTQWTTAINIENGAVMTINNVLPTFCATESLCNSTPFSYYVPASQISGTSGPNPFDMYINPGTSNPNTDGNVYKIMYRDVGIYAGGYGAGGNGSIIRNSITTTAVDNGGSVYQYTNATASQCMYAFGHKHNMQGTSGTWTDCIAYDADGFPSGPGPFVFNAPFTTPTYSWTMERCMFIAPAYRGIQISAIYGHGNNTTPFISTTVDACIVTNAQFFGNPQSEKSVFSNCYGLTCGAPAGNTGAANTSATTTTVTQFILNQLNNTQDMISVQYGATTYQNCAFYVGTTTQGAQLINISGAFYSFTMENCTIYGGSRTGWYNNQTAGLINLSYNVFAYDPNFRASINIESGQTYTGDYNVFYRLYSTYSDYFIGIYNGTTYTTLSSWQTATGQDSHSVYLTLAQYNNFFLGNPANGDFRINPNAQVTAANGTVYTGTFPDGTPITNAGMQQHYNYNTRAIVSGANTAWPTVPTTYSQCVSYITSPQTWVY